MKDIILVGIFLEFNSWAMFTNLKNQLLFFLRKEGLAQLSVIKS